VPASLERVIRVLVHWNTELAQNEIIHVYLRDAVKLRPDLVAAQ
jgi:chorismate mutase